jgi:ABC-type iron transport system FetAB ATPase subunit
MRQIIHSYKLRLTNLSQGNRSLKLARLSAQKDMDLLDLGGLEKESAEALFEKLLAGKDIRLINKLDARYERTNLADRRLNKIFRQLNTFFEETGSYDLYLGYPFVEGSFADGTKVRCPLLLFPVSLERNLQSKPRWKLNSTRDEPVQFNRTFLLAYEQFQKVRFSPEFWEEEVERSPDWQQWLNDLYGLLKTHEVEVNFNSKLFERKLQRFIDMKADEMESFKAGVMKLQPYAVLGVFPQSDSSLLQDYEQIEAAPDQFQLEQFFPSLDEQLLPHEEEAKVASYIKEESRYFVTKVDQNQEEALLQIKQGESLVLHGPPGTGKSQVIVNIIADALAHGKKVLLVSQKRAALDVVYKRLGALGLSRYAVLVHDYRHDRGDIYRKIKKQIDDIEIFKKAVNDLNITKWEHDYKLLSRQVDQLSRQFEELNEASLSRTRFGISPHDLYLQTDAQALILPLGEEARQMTYDRLSGYLEKLDAIMDYADLLAPDHSWVDRISFQHYTHDDRQRIQALLEKISGDIQKLYRGYQQLQQKLGKEILDTGDNQQKIDQYNRIQALLATPSIREDIEAIYKDELETAFVKKKLEQMGTILDELEEIELLKDFPWTLYSDLKKHVENYRKHEKAFGRMLIPAFLRARWFLKKWLTAKGKKLDLESFKQVKREFRLFSRLHGHYSRTYELDFFHDFPLLDDLSSKQNWLDRKQKHFAAYRQVKDLKFFKDLKPVFTFGKLDVAHWEHSKVLIAELDTLNRQLRDTFADWRRYLSAGQCEGLKAGIKTQGAAADFLQTLRKELAESFADIKDLDILLASLSLAETQILEKTKASSLWKEKIDTAEQEIRESVKNSIFFFWIEALEQETPILAEVSSRGWERKRSDYARKLDARADKVAELIQRRIQENIIQIIQYNRLRNPITYRQIYHQVSKKRRLWSVRRLASETWNTGLKELVPCWMASPESASAIFPMKKDFFDVVVFDEASQCFVERAIPVLLRGKQVVIAGDDKQLQPFDLYKVKYEEDESAFMENEIAMEVESILDLAKRSLQERPLHWHYRSREEELINFSNHAFYEGKLQVIPPASHDPINHPPLEWIPVAGIWEKTRNLIEADRVVSLVEELVQREDRPSLGVVTFNFHQQELIKDRLDARLEELATENTALYTQFLESLQRTDDEAFQGLFVKNIENVQGDERDIIIFSIGYAPDHKGILRAQFGLLNQQGGQNRLNVAISRARKKIFVVCSFLPSQLKVDHVKHDGPRFLKQYLSYVKAINDQRKEESLSILNQQNANDITQYATNPIADEIASELREAGYHVIRNFGDTAYKLDLAVKASAESDTFLLGIEVEGAYYFSGATSKEREVYRPMLLQARGWQIHRVWARNWWKDRAKEMGKIRELVDES